MRILVAYVRVLFLFFIYTYRLRVAHDERGTVLSTFFFLFFFLALLIFITISVYKTITHLRASQSLKVNEFDNNIIYIYIYIYICIPLIHWHRMPPSTF